MFVLGHGLVYEFEDVVGVYSTLDKAIAAVEPHIQGKKWEATKAKYLASGEIKSWTYGDYYYHIKEFEVDAPALKRKGE